MPRRFHRSAAFTGSAIGERPALVRQRGSSLKSVFLNCINCIDCINAINCAPAKSWQMQLTSVDSMGSRISGMPWFTLGRTQDLMYDPCLLL